MTDSQSLIQNIAITGETRNLLFTLDIWLMNEEIGGMPSESRVHDMSDDELCARHLGFLLRLIPLQFDGDDFYDMLKVAFGVFESRASEFERVAYSEDLAFDSYRNPAIEQFVGLVGDANHILTLEGIRAHTLEDLETRVEVTKALLTILASTSRNWIVRDSIVRAMPDTIVATLAMYFHIHEQFGFGRKGVFPFGARPWYLINEIGRRASFS